MRETVQSKLNEILEVESGEFRADDILENGQSYFGYRLRNNYVNSDMDNTYEMSLNINGYLSRLDDKTENTLQIIDNQTQQIVEKLKSLGFRTTYEDVSITNNVRKIHITGRTKAQDNVIIGGGYNG